MLSGDGYLTPEKLTHIRWRLTSGAALFVLYIVIAMPGIQDVVRDYELNDWETTEGTVFATPGILNWYLYSVDDVEYTGSKAAFRWSQTWSDNRSTQFNLHPPIGSSIEVFYDPDDHDFSRLIMPEYNHRKLIPFTGVAFAGLLALALVPPESPERKEKRKKASAERKEKRKKASAERLSVREKFVAADKEERKAAREKRVAETERPVAKGEPISFLHIIGGIVAFWILIMLLDSGILEDLPSGGGGGCGLDICGLCLAPFAAGGAALSRSSTGKFSDGQTGPSSKGHPDLAKVTYCLHTKDNGKKCTRMVMRQSGLCYQHQDSDAAEAYLEAIGSDTSGDVLRYNIDGANKAISSKDIDVLIERLGEAKKFWVVDLGLDEAEFVQFTYDGDIDDDGIRDGQPVLEHWRGGRKILTNRIGLEKSLEILRSLLHGE